MQFEVIKVIKLFKNFLRFFDALQVHKMMAIMLDPCLKALWSVKKLVGCKNVILLAFEYDAKL
jgi:hypothetical protein